MFSLPTLLSCSKHVSKQARDDLVLQLEEEKNKAAEEKNKALEATVAAKASELGADKVCTCVILEYVHA